MVLKCRHIGNDSATAGFERDFVAYPIFLFFVDGFVLGMNPQPTAPRGPWLKPSYERLVFRGMNAPAPSVRPSWGAARVCKKLWE